MKCKVFLGGTCNKSTWRDKIIKSLTDSGIDYFNPVVSDWTQECQEEEERQKWNECNIHLYVITPKMTGTFSIAEAVESAMSANKIIGCVFCVVKEDEGKTFDEGQLRSLKAVCKLIEKYNGWAVQEIEGATTAIRIIARTLEIKSEIKNAIHTDGFLPHKSVGI